MSTPYTPPPPTQGRNDVPFKLVLRDLPLPVRLTLSVFLLAVALGYFSALLQLHFKNATRGQPLPTPDDVVEIFSGVENWPVPKPAPPKPVSKMERLVMAPADLPHNGSGTMAFAFFKGVQKAIDKDPAKGEHLRQCREAEQRAVQAWINLPDDQRKQAYEDDASPLPELPAGHAVDEDDLNDGKFKIKSVIDARCSSCHADSSMEGKKKLVDYDDFADVLVVPPAGHTSRQMSLESLTQTTHLHLLTFSLLWGMTGLIFAFSSCWKWLRCVLAPLVLLAQVADVACWWLARLPNVGPYFALTIIGTGTIVAVGLFLQVVLSLLDMYRLRGKIVLLLLFVAAGAGVAYFATEAQQYLNTEAATAAAPAEGGR